MNTLVINKRRKFMDRLNDYILEKLSEAQNKSEKEIERTKKSLEKLKILAKRGYAIIDENLRADWIDSIIIANDLYCLNELEDALKIIENLNKGNLDKADEIFNKERGELSCSIMMTLISKFSKNSHLLIKKPISNESKTL